MRVVAATGRASLLIGSRGAYRRARRRGIRRAAAARRECSLRARRVGLFRCGGDGQERAHPRARLAQLPPGVRGPLGPGACWRADGGWWFNALKFFRNSRLSTVLRRLRHVYHAMAMASGAARRREGARRARGRPLEGRSGSAGPATWGRLCRGTSTSRGGAGRRMGPGLVFQRGAGSLRPVRWPAADGAARRPGACSARGRAGTRRRTGAPSQVAVRAKAIAGLGRDDMRGSGPGG